MNALVSQNFNAPSTVFANTPVEDDLGAGIASSMAIVSLRGGKWRIKFGGNERLLEVDTPNGKLPVPYLDVVILRASTVLSKMYYAAGYDPNSKAPPDCSSTNGVKPDANIQTPVSTSCLGCPMNAFGSRPSAASPNGKACQDSKRIAIVPASDIANEPYGGPMLLRIPAGSLKDLKAVGEALKQRGFPYYGAVMRLSFSGDVEYPKLVFTAIKPLNDAEAKLVMQLREDDRTKRIISEVVAEERDGAAAAAAAPQTSGIAAGFGMAEQPTTQTLEQLAGLEEKPVVTETVIPAQPKDDGITVVEAKKQAAAARRAEAAAKAKAAAEEAARLAKLAEEDDGEDESDTTTVAPVQQALPLEGEIVGGASDDFDAMLEGLLKK